LFDVSLKSVFHLSCVNNRPRRTWIKHKMQLVSITYNLRFIIRVQGPTWWSQLGASMTVKKGHIYFKMK